MKKLAEELAEALRRIKELEGEEEGGKRAVVDNGLFILYD